MSWVAPSTVTPGQVATAALWNEQVRDNMKIGRGRAKATRNAGDVTANSTTWANFDTGIDISLNGAAADWYFATMDRRTNTGAVIILFDARTVTGSAYFGGAVETNTGVGINGLAGLSGVENWCSARHGRQMVAGDFSAGACNVRWRYRTTAAVNKTVFASALGETVVHLENVGPNVTP